MTTELSAAIAALRGGAETERRDAIGRLQASGAAEAVAPLLHALSDDSWAVRQRALQSLREWPAAVVEPQLENALRDGSDAQFRNAAMEVYVERRAVGTLKELLKDGDEDVRNFAAVMLGRVGDTGASASLITVLGEDPDPNVRHAAAVSLGQIGVLDAVPHLISALEQEPWLQVATIGALRDIGDARAVPALVARLPDSLFTSLILEALGAMGGREVLPDVVAWLTHSDPAIRNEAVRAIVAIEQRATAEGASLDPGVQQALRREQVGRHLLDMLDDDAVENRRTATITLGWLREERAESRLMRLLAEPALQEFAAHALVAIGCRDREAYREALASPVDPMRQGAVRCLAWIAPSGAMELVAPMIHDPSPDVRAEAASAVGRLGDADAAMLLFELLGDEHELIQEAAREALARMPPDDVRPVLRRAFEMGEEVVRVRAAETAGRMLDRSLSADLMALTDDPREAVRRAALQALGEIEADGATEILRRALKDPSSVVRLQAVASLGHMRDAEVADELLALLVEEDTRIVFVALQALGRLRCTTAVPRLIEHLDHERKPLRFAAIEALGQVRAPAATAHLARILSDPDRHLRRGAAESLGAIGGADAVVPLLASLEDEHWSVRCACAAALGKTGSHKATTGLVARLDDDDATVGRAVATALGEIGDPRAVAPLLEVIGNAALESAAVDALRRIGPAALAEIERRFPSFEAAGRRLLIDIVSRCDDRRAVRILLSALLDDSADVRGDAAQALGELGSVDAARALMNLKAEDPSPAVRRAAGRALGRLAPR